MLTSFLNKKLLKFKVTVYLLCITLILLKSTHIRLYLLGIELVTFFEEILEFSDMLTMLTKQNLIL